MINIPINPTNPVTPQPVNKKPSTVQPSTGVHSDRSARPEPVKPKVDRRKKDRRNSRTVARGPYDMRTGRDRRKSNQPKPNIDTEV